MRVFAIGDLHLEGNTGKTMDRFGENWRDHDRHGEAIKTALTGQRERTRYYLVSADAVDFAPAEINVGEMRKN